MKNFISLDSQPLANSDSVIVCQNARFTILTNRLIRCEYSSTGVFKDCPTKTVLNRKFPLVDFSVQEDSSLLKITTDSIMLEWKKQSLIADSASSDGFFKRLTITVCGKSSCHYAWNYSPNYKTEQPGNLGGTARTLDNADGRIPLENGILSRYGWAILDDTETPCLKEDGWFSFGENATSNNSFFEECDFYFFGYSHDYYVALDDFYKLTGKQPILPRYALGSWWSRYYPYKQEEYKELMTRFKNEELPFSVAVIDMDWHITNPPKEYGGGWTGFSWNKELFPNPQAFLQWLHDNGLRVTLNLHPADGVRGFEDAFPKIKELLCKELGLSQDLYEKAIPFMPENEAFMKAYFEAVLEPLEADGVDFWWIDWQQGEELQVPGLDPLWVLNHYHFIDSVRKHGLGLTFSRYAGPGSHRYPIGFSGDTVISWESLAFQIEFTAKASNVGYGWWSHDIGGHMLGKKDDELALRWLEFGVFSPIMRLHSSCNVFNGKEPWRYALETQVAMKKYLQFRHRLVPYLDSMNIAGSKNNIPLVRPLYYDYPEIDEAYNFNNEYFLGSEMLVCPIVQKADTQLHWAKVECYLPAGDWYDIFTGIKYSAQNKGRVLTLWRAKDEIPVFVKSGSVFVLGKEVDAKNCSNIEELPQNLEIYAFGDEDGEFSLYEQTSQTETPILTTKIEYKSKASAGQQIKIGGDNAKRKFDIVIHKDDNKNLLYQRFYDFLNQAEIEFVLKDRLYYTIAPVFKEESSDKDRLNVLASLRAILDLNSDKAQSSLNDTLYSILVEFLTM